MISCKEYVAIRKEYLKNEIAKHKTEPRLVVIQVDSDPASSTYVKNKKKVCDEVGIMLSHINLNSEDITQEMFEEIVYEIGKADSVNGIIIQLPIPKKYDVNALLECIPKDKDVDGFRRDSLFTSCTPKGIMDWLKYNEYDLVGKNVVVLGRSNIVGKPLVNLMIEEGATVTCCNSKTNRERRIKLTQEADVVISAVGKAKFLDFSDFIEAEIIVDVGINRDEHGKLCGDVNTIDFEKYLPYTYVTPVPGGVGVMTTVSLAENTYQAFLLHQNKRV